MSDGIFACHGRPEDDNAYMLENIVGGHLVLASRAQISERVRMIAARVVLCGHSHIPLIVTADRTIIVNPGSVGQPAYQDPTMPAHVSETGSPHARYAIVNVDPDRVEAEMISVPYDHLAAAKRAEASGGGSWAHFLATGFAKRQVAP